MDRGVSKELEREIRDTLELFIEAKPGYRFQVSGNEPGLVKDALAYLADVNVLRGSFGEYRLTAEGRDYWEKLNAPRWYWFRRNWFAASVAAGTILFSGAATAANILNLVT